MSDNETYPRILNGEGCLYGRHLHGELLELKKGGKERMCKLEKKLDRLTWAAISVAIGLATTTVTLLVTNLVP